MLTTTGRARKQLTVPLYGRKIAYDVTFRVDFKRYFAIEVNGFGGKTAVAIDLQSANLLFEQGGNVIASHIVKVTGRMLSNGGISIRIVIRTHDLHVHTREQFTLTPSQRQSVLTFLSQEGIYGR